MKKKKSFKELIHGSQPVLVDFMANWCGPCKSMKPVLEEVKKQIGERATIIKVDIDKNQRFATKMQVTGVPTFVLFKEGKELWRQVGMQTKTQLLQVLETHQ